MKQPRRKGRTVSLSDAVYDMVLNMPVHEEASGLHPTVNEKAALLDKLATADAAMRWTGKRERAKG